MQPDTPPSDQQSVDAFRELGALTETRRVTVVVEDHTGNKQRKARIVADAQVNDIIPALITALELPVTDPTGRPITYHIAVNGRQITGNQTLAESNVVDGAALTIVPEMTAGGLWPARTIGTGWPPASEDAGCPLRGGGRKLLVEEIIAAVEARMLVKVENEPTPEKDEAEVKLGILVRPIFGAPLDEVAFRSDVFMMMPFAPTFQTIYEDHIKAVVAEAGLRISRADDFFSHHSIITEIWTAIFMCRFAIADCTGRNPNVMYELGIAHTLGKPVIMLSQSVDDLPFDIQSRRVIIYKDSAAGIKALQVDMRRVIGMLMADANTGT
jgi:hypothetical protein